MSPRGFPTSANTLRWPDLSAEAKLHRERIRKEEKEAIEKDHLIKEIDLIRRIFGEVTAEAHIKSMHEEPRVHDHETLIHDALDAGYTRKELALCFPSLESEAMVIEELPDMAKPMPPPPPPKTNPKVKYRFPGAGRKTSAKMVALWSLPKPRITPPIMLGSFLPEQHRREEEPRRGPVPDPDPDPDVTRPDVSNSTGPQDNGFAWPIQQTKSCDLPAALQNRQARIRRLPRLNPKRSYMAVVMAGRGAGAGDKASGGRRTGEPVRSVPKHGHPQFTRGRGDRGRGNGGHG